MLVREVFKEAHLLAQGKVKCSLTKARIRRSAPAEAASSSSTLETSTFDTTRMTTMLTHYHRLTFFLVMPARVASLL